MESTRYDIYGLVHKGLRACMAHTLTTVGRSDWSDADDSLQALAATRELLDFCATHLQLEDQLVHTAMEARQAGSSRDSQQDHQLHVTEIEALRADIEQLESLPAAARARSAQAAYRRLAHFVGENYVHMELEERENNALLWQMFSDEELHNIELAIVAALTPTESARALRWMLPFVSHPERVEILGDMRRTAPTPVYSGALDAVHPLLSRRDRARLESALAGQK